MNRLIRLVTIAAIILLTPWSARTGVAADSVQAATGLDKDAGKTRTEEKKLDPKEIIFEHLGDAYGWEVPFNHHKRIPLPVIVVDHEGSTHVFMSHHLEHGASYEHNGKTFKIAGKESPDKGKVVEVDVDGKEIKVKYDISVTKDVAAILITVIVVSGLMLWHAGWYRRKRYLAPRKGLGFVELITCFIYDGVVCDTLGEKAHKFAPYLLTVFWFILVANLMGLMVVFPGGANLTGNIACTLVLSIITFLVTNIFATKHYWKEIFWPDVPLWLKFPLPIMPAIEIFGMFTKPAALTVRLFANMMGGHMIVLVLTLLIFIFAAVSPAAGGGATVISLAFSVFMLLIDVLVSFIQAYVFTMLSTIFISLAQEKGHEDEKHLEQQDDRSTLDDAILADTTGPGVLGAVEKEAATAK